MSLTKSELESAIAELESFKLARLQGKHRIRVSYEGSMVEKVLPSLSEINQGLAQYQAQLTGITGQSSGLGPIRPGFGGRK